MIGISVMHSPDLNTNLNSPAISPDLPYFKNVEHLECFKFAIFLNISTEFDTNVKSLAISVALPSNGSCLNAWSCSSEGITDLGSNWLSRSR